MCAKSIKGRVRPADTDLAAAVRDAIEWLTTVPNETIRVTARDGWLYLGGRVDWWHQRDIIEEVTRRLPGVEAVVNSIEVRSKPTQAEVREAVL